MNAQFFRTLAVCVLLVGLLAGCATTAARQDLGGVPNADNPEYPEKFSALGIRIAMNYITYSMTH